MDMAAENHALVAVGTTIRTLWMVWWDFMFSCVTLK